MYSGEGDTPKWTLSIEGSKYFERGQREGGGSPPGEMRGIRAGFLEEAMPDSYLQERVSDRQMKDKEGIGVRENSVGRDLKTKTGTAPAGNIKKVTELGFNPVTEQTEKYLFINSFQSSNNKPITC